LTEAKYLSEKHTLVCMCVREREREREREGGREREIETTETETESQLINFFLFCFAVPSLLLPTHAIITV